MLMLNLMLMLIRHYTPGGFREKGEVVLVLKEESEERGGGGLNVGMNMSRKKITPYFVKNTTSKPLHERPTQTVVFYII